MILDDDPPLPPEAPEPSGASPRLPEMNPGDPPLVFPDLLAVDSAPAPPAKFVPEDLRVPWGWLDLLLFLLIVIGASFLLGVVVVLGFMAFGVTINQLRVSARAQGVFNIVFEVLLFMGLLGYLALQMRLRFGKPFWQTIGWKRLEMGKLPSVLSYAGFIGGGILLAVVVQIGSVAFGTKTKLPIEQLFQDRLTAALILVLAVLMAPVVEETIFRGYIYPVVARSFGQGVGIVATGTLFGLLHAAQLWGGWTQIVLLVIVGIVFTYARAVKRTVLASFLLHVSYNSCVSLAFLVGSHFLRVLPTGP